jgi:hypothetical protein
MEDGLWLSEFAHGTLTEKMSSARQVMSNFYPLSAERTRKAIRCVSQAYAHKCAQLIILRDKANH